jgi:long-chain fatty acid transport protein
MQYQISKKLLIGAAYVSPSNLDINDADISFNFSGLGLGNVNYSANLKGLKQPQELGIGFSFLISNRLTLSMEANWIDWSNAINSSTLMASNPDNPFAPSEITIDTNYNWKDQYVFSAGIIYKPDDNITIRSGFNYAKQPIPNENLSPLLPLIGERHFAFGIGYKFDKKWEFNATFVRDLPNSVTYTNNESIFGPNARENYSATLYMATISLLW